LPAGTENGSRELLAGCAMFWISCEDEKRSGRVYPVLNDNYGK
jgi:hypothetical protein